MNDQNANLEPQKAAAERGPETVLPGPRSLSALDELHATVMREFNKAWDACDGSAWWNFHERGRRSGRLVALAEVLDEIERHLCQASKVNREALRRRGKDAMKSKETQSRRSQQRMVRRHDRALILAIETLALYANPESYHAIAMLCDRPSGWFADDVSKTDHPHYDRKMHGAAARKALAKIQKLVTPNDQAVATASTKLL